MPVILTVNKSTEMKSSITTEQNECDVNFSSMPWMYLASWPVSNILWMQLSSMDENAAIWLRAVLMKQTSICCASRATEFATTSPAPLLFSFSSISMCILHDLTLLRMHTVDQYLLKKLQIFVLFDTSASGHFCLNLQWYCL